MDDDADAAVDFIDKAEWTAFEVLEFFTSTIPDLPAEVVSSILEDSLAGRMQQRIKPALQRLLGREVTKKFSEEPAVVTENKDRSPPPAGSRRSLASALTSSQAVGDESTHLSKWNVAQVTDFLTALSFLFEEKTARLQELNYNGAKLALCTTDSIKADLGVDDSVARYVVAMVRRTVNKGAGIPPVAAPVSTQTRSRAHTHTVPAKVVVAPVVHTAQEDERILPVPRTPPALPSNSRGSSPQPPNLPPTPEPPPLPD